MKRINKIGNDGGVRTSTVCPRLSVESKIRHAGRTRAAVPSRRGFSLIELLIVIAVIGILMAFILPAVGNARLRARIAEVTTEMSKFEAAIEVFKGNHGPVPSAITLSQLGDTAAGPADRWSPRAKTILRRMFPEIDFDLAHDFDGDPATTAPIELRGAECLVLFLGGLRDTDGNFVGFSKNPTDPLDVANLGGSRDGPFFEFDLSRIQVDTSGRPIYYDPLPGSIQDKKPYLYASSSGGRGYQTSDLGYGGAQKMTDIYRSGSTASSPPFNRNSFQIISPGADGEYGTGGPFDPEAPNASLNTPARKVESDNITNFQSGVLNP